MTDADIEGLAKAMYEDTVKRRNYVHQNWEDVSKSEWLAFARAALAHLGERPGIWFEGMDDYMLTQMRDVLYREGFQIQVDAIDAELARRNPAPPEPADEWREAIEDGMLRSRDYKSLPDAILAAIAPLREKLEKDARNWKFVAECEKKANATDRRRAEAAEAKLRRLMKVFRVQAFDVNGDQIAIAFEPNIT